jgi:hypothetical protein
MLLGTALRVYALYAHAAARDVIQLSSDGASFSRTSGMFGEAADQTAGRHPACFRFFDRRRRIGRVQAYGD